MIDDLERSLRRLGAEIEFPPTPGLAVAVRLRLAERPQRRLVTRWRLAIAAALAGVVLVLGVPGIRTAVAHWLGIGGVVITPVQSLPPHPSAPPSLGALGQSLYLGQTSSLGSAQQVAGFAIAVPSLYGAPDAVYVRSDLGETISLVYRPRPGLPAAAQTGVGLLITELRASVDARSMQKFVGPDTTITPVVVGGGPGFWLGGAPHDLLLLLPDGSMQGDTLRLAGPTLLFERGDVTVRIEGALTEAEALAIAASLK